MNALPAHAGSLVQGSAVPEEPRGFTITSVPSLRSTTPYAPLPRNRQPYTAQP